MQQPKQYNNYNKQNQPSKETVETNQQFPNWPCKTSLGLKSALRMRLLSLSSSSLINC